MGKKQYDIFISYRRIGGETTARIISERLSDMGYRVFFDVEALRSGDFNIKLYSVIEECNDFLIILSPNSLDRCKDEDDWVRLEVTHALKHNKNIIPVMLRGFSFPSNLPKEIENLRYKNGIEANSEFFDAFINKLSKFIKSKTTITRRIYQNVVFRRTLPFIIALFLTTGIILGGRSLYNKNLKTETFPNSQEDKNIVNEVLDYVSQNLTNYNLMVEKTEDTYKACESYLVNPNVVEYEKVVSLIGKSRDDILKMDIKKDELKSQLDSKVDKTPIEKDDLVALNTIVVQQQEELSDCLQYMTFLIGDYSVFNSATKEDIMKIYIELLDNDRKHIVYGINDLLLPIDNKYIADFKRNTLTVLTSLPFDESKWLTEKTDIENQMLANKNKSQELINKLSSIVGSQNVDYQKEIEKYRENLKNNGLSNEEIDKYISEIIRSADDITKLKTEIQKSEDDLKKIYDEAKEKYKPLETDEANILWGKMLRFLNLRLYDEAITCVQIYHQKVNEKDKYAYIYVPVVIEFINNIRKTGIDYGIMVIGYEPNRTEHEIYKIGDVIIAVNDKQCLNYNSYSNFKVTVGDEITLLRINSEGGFDTVRVTAVKNQSKVLFAQLTERE